MPINPNHAEINVAVQKNDPDSILSYYKKLIRIRKDSAVAEALSLGDFQPALLEYGDLIAYKRIGESSSALVINNYKKESQEVLLPCSVKSVVLSNYDEGEVSGDKLVLKPYQAVVFEV